ncbi:MAG: nucleoside deaminase [Candidatus Gastranaerophilales bacterium]|nr:nucleoside deaminase [Candidatus Gastranaerophilales bacterium]
MLNKYFDILINEAKNVKTDIPICAMIVKDDEIISLKSNAREKNNSTIAHAEILAIKEANEKLSSWRLDDCDMYVTLEPCPMCGWAIINARIKNIYFGSYDTKYGAFSVLNLKNVSNSKINIYGGIKEIECNKLLDDYFKGLRDEK